MKSGQGSYPARQRYLDSHGSCTLWPDLTQPRKALDVSIDELTGSYSESGRVLSDVDLILQDCTEEERKLLVEILRVVKEVLHGKVVQESSRNDSNTFSDRTW